jgi:hypothetical protein
MVQTIRQVQYAPNYHLKPTWHKIIFSIRNKPPSLLIRQSTQPPPPPPSQLDEKPTTLISPSRAYSFSGQMRPAVCSPTQSQTTPSSSKSISSTESRRDLQRRQYYLRFWGGEPHLEQQRGRTSTREWMVDYSNDREYAKLNDNGIAIPDSPENRAARNRCQNSTSKDRYQGSLIFPLSLTLDVNLPQWSEKTSVTLSPLRRYNNV